MSDRKHTPTYVQRRNGKELEEQRKLGLAPLAVDAVTGADISPHVTETLACAPFYRRDLGTAPTLAHHAEGLVMGGSANTSLPSGSTTTKIENASHFIAGSCQNCGSAGHKAQNCLRPKRRMTACTSGKSEAVGSTVMVDPTMATFEIRNESSRTNNYDSAWSKAIESAAIAQTVNMSTSFESTSAKSGQRSAATELGQLPKYLENLDDDTFYDPRTRSMRGNPNALKKHDPAIASSAFAGDNALLHTTGYFKHADHQLKFLTGTTSNFVDLLSDVDERRRQIEDRLHAQWLRERAATVSDALYGPTDDHFVV